MSFTVGRYEHPQVRDLDPTILVLEHSDGHRVEIWPGAGFNTFRWVVPGPNGTPLELLYADPGLFTEGRPTRSGIPVLFPFPNRIAGGTFTLDGTTWTLPRNDPAQANAIHGFACRRPWTLIDEGADATSARVTGCYDSRSNGGEWADAWPAAHRLTLTLTLGTDLLRLDAEVHNPDTKPLPFGLGYHPYFALPFLSGIAAEDCLIQVPAASFWDLKELIPTGDLLPVGIAHDLNVTRRFGDLFVDDILTELPLTSVPLPLRARIAGTPGYVLQLYADLGFRDLVVFTPPHRQAFCVEPYTCPTDAINLTARGVDCGWQTLAPGGTARFVVELRLARGATIQPHTLSGGAA